MATETKPRHVTVDDRQVTINDFTTSERDIHSYFANLPESEDLDKKLEYALKVGVIAAKTIETAGNVDYVEKEFNKIAAGFSQGIEEVFGDKGRFSQLLVEQFGEDGLLLKEYLNPDKDGSPFNLFLKAFTAKIEELKILVLREKVKEEVENNTTKKGDRFEEYVEPLLGEIARIHSDGIEPTGKKHGKVGVFAGDFVQTVNELNKKIVWETKNYSTRLSMSDIHDNLDRGMENREADYGILVSHSVDALPKEVGWFKPLPDNKLVVALCDHEDCELHNEFLHIAYKWARAQLLIASSKKSKINSKFIQEKTVNILQSMKQLTTIKARCTAIDKASSSIRALTEAVEQEIDEELEEIVDSLKLGK